jgi:hypothetical protein
MGELNLRDDQILACIQETGDGVLARRHLKRMFWADKSLRAMQKVMARLVGKRFIKRETIQYRRFANPRSEPVYWLDYKGILHVCEQMGIEELYYPKSEGERQLRLLEGNIRKKEGIRWLRHLPSIGKLEHHLAVVDFKMKLLSDIAQLPLISMMVWVNESAFRSPTMDKVRFTIRDKDGWLVEKERGVCPDGFCLIADNERKSRGEDYKLYLLVELDMATYPVRSRWATNKAGPYAAYINSPAFWERFGINTGYWLVITTGEGRMRHLMQKTQQTVGEGARCFLFTTWAQVNNQDTNVLTAPIWSQVGEAEPIYLLT